MLLERVVKGREVQLGGKCRGHLGFVTRSPSHRFADRWSEWKLAVSGGCLFLQPEGNVMRQKQQDRSWGDVRRSFMLERRGQVEPCGVCSSNYASQV